MGGGGVCDAVHPFFSRRPPPKIAEEPKSPQKERRGGGWRKPFLTTINRLTTDRKTRPSLRLIRFLFFPEFRVATGAPPKAPLEVSPKVFAHPSFTYLDGLKTVAFFQPGFAPAELLDPIPPSFGLWTKMGSGHSPQHNYFVTDSVPPNLSISKRSGGFGFRSFPFAPSRGACRRPRRRSWRLSSRTTTRTNPL